MRFSTAGTLAAFLAIQQATANWFTDDCFPSPENCDNQCSDQQKSGFDWSGLATGSFSSYGGLDFSGFTCSDKPSFAKRNDIGGGKCIEGSISSGSGPKISCGADQKGFSITSFKVYASEKTDVDFIYGMPDGSTCKHTATCEPEGTEVTNSQCGGATSVGFQISPGSSVKSCGLGISSISFDCSPGKPGHSSTASIPVITPTVPAIPSVSVPSIPETTPSAPGASSTPESTPASSSPAESSSVVPSSSVPQVTPSSGSSSVPAVSSPSTTKLTTSTVYTTTEVTITSCAPTVTNCPANSVTVVTSTIAISTTVCPVTETETSTPAPTPAAPAGGATPSGSSPVETGSSAAPSAGSGSGSSSSSPAGSPAGSAPSSAPAPSAGSGSSSALGASAGSSSSTVPAAPASSTGSTGSTGSSGSGSCPAVVPKCINTWLPSNCTSNSDNSCYCPSSNFTNNVIQCIQSWGADQAEIQSALSYFTGICSGYIPSNPGIVSAIPSTITLAPPTPSATGSAGASAAAGVAPSSVPCTTITYASSTYTVPQVTFTTVTAPGASSVSVGLVPVTSAAAAVQTQGSTPAGVAAGATTLATSAIVVPTGSLPSPKASSSLTPFLGAAAPSASAASGLWLAGTVSMLLIYLI
ncbi:hypothetical protein VTN77DRAFT_8182 [Rasamsonia byssochlamydoides]|uniref:uncharacterized protein n=1 Tax=Rasamsonia byssochlamydoides TaxID=89139 RepID=UPI003742D2BA